MSTKPFRYQTILSILFAALLRADNHGADPALTAAPGEAATSCTACHSGTALNAGSGSVKIVLPSGNTYTPGVTQRIKVSIADSSQRRWGYELTARLGSNPSASQAGDLSLVDSNSQVMCANGRSKPCASASTIQYITHTLSGSRNGTVGAVEFEFDWTPPATDSGRVTLYAAANAANGDNRNTGDHIYTASLNLDPAQAEAARPAIRSERGIVSAASLLPGIAAGSWITVMGTDLASTTRTWTPADFVDGMPPTSLDGVGVSINGKAAYVQAISPTRLTVLAPADDSVGPVEVRVSSGERVSDPVNVELLSLAPALFLNEDGKHVLLAEAGKSLIAEPGLLPTLKPEKTAVKPGDTILIYGSSFGPAEPDGRVTGLTLTIAGVNAEIVSATLVPGAVQLFQITFTVPDGLPAGDQAVVVQLGSAKSAEAAECCFVTVEP